jgi:hypothetical protein
VWWWKYLLIAFMSLLTAAAAVLIAPWRTERREARSSRVVGRDKTWVERPRTATIDEVEKRMVTVE